MRFSRIAVPLGQSGGKIEMMTKRRLSIVLSIGVMAATALPAVAQNWGGDSPRDGACFYEHPNFGGQYFCESVGASRDVPPAANDRISSIRIFGNASVTVFQDTNFRNASMRFDNDQTDLERVGWDDRISSFRIGTRRYGGGSWGRPTTPSSGACFYEDPDFRGDYFCASAGSATSQVPDDANDRISSIRIFGSASVTVFQDVNFRNASMRFDSDQRNLERVGWDDRISSFRIDARGGSQHGGDRGYNTEAQWTYPQAQAMVQRAYRSVLGRDPDAGAASWVNETIKNHWSQGQLEDALKNTPEYRQKHK